MAQIDPPGGMGFCVKIGSVLELANSASGRVLLAFRDGRECQRLLDLAKPGMTDKERSDILDTIKKVANDGFAFMRSNQFSGLEAISYPVLDLRGRAIAALTIPYVRRLDDPDFMSAKETQVALATTVASLNAAIGGAINGPRQAVGLSRSSACKAISVLWIVGDARRNAATPARWPKVRFRASRKKPLSAWSGRQRRL